MTGEYVELCHRYLYEQLSDGQWHPLEPLLVQMMKWVPPGVAMRRTKKDRQLNRDRRAAEGRPVGVISPAASRQATDHMLRVGARRTAWNIVGSTKGPYETKQEADGIYLVRLVRMPTVIRGDRARATQLQPAFDGLADHFTAAGMDYAAEQIQLTAHEFGFHLRTCPRGCSLTRRTREALQRMHVEVDEQDDEPPDDDVERHTHAVDVAARRPPPWSSASASASMGISTPEEWANVRAFLAGHRRKMGWPQYEIARRMGTGQSTVSQLENGKVDTTASMLARYVRALELPPDICSRVKDTPPPPANKAAPEIHQGEC